MQPGKQVQAQSSQRRSACSAPAQLAGIRLPTQAKSQAVGSRRLGGTALYRSRSPLLATAGFSAELAPTPLAADLLLRSWVEAHGGFVHPALRLVDSAPCGVRGVVTTTPLTQAEAEEGPLIVVPERLYLTSELARARLAGSTAVPGTDALGSSPGGSPAAAAAAGRLPAAMQLALLLAAERAKGATSFYYPYISSLPAQLPCGWAQEGPSLDAALAAVGCPSAEGWRDDVRAARRAVEQRAVQAVQLCGRYLDAPVTADDIVWSLGQVLSRSFGHEPDVALAPYIDLCNHRQGSPQPGAFTRDAPEGGAEQGEQEEEVYAFVESSFGGRPLALAAGDEVYISYVASNAAAKQAFLNLGFVPPELLRPRAFSSNSRGA